MIVMATEHLVLCLLYFVNFPFDVLCGDVTDIGVPDDSSLRYWLHSNDVTSGWDEADDICKTTYSGGHLAALPTAEVADFVQDQLYGSQGILTDTYPDPVVWLGGRRSPNDTWRLLDGSSARYGELGREHRPGQELDCLIWTSQLFLAEACDRRYEHFICFLRGDACVTAQSSPDGCFSLRRGEELTWYQSRQKCQDLGGDLADVDYYNQNVVATVLRNSNETWAEKAWIKPKRHPWEWSFSKRALEYYDWSYYKLHMTGENCLQTAPDGWRPANCTHNVTSHFLCTQLIDPTNPGASTQIELIDPTDPEAYTTTGFTSLSTDETESGNNLLVIIGSLTGVISALVIVIIILVILRFRKASQNDPVPSSVTSGNGNQDNHTVLDVTTPEGNYESVPAASSDYTYITHDDDVMGQLTPEYMTAESQHVAAGVSRPTGPPLTGDYLVPTNNERSTLDTTDDGTYLTTVNPIHDEYLTTSGELGMELHHSDAGEYTSNQCTNDREDRAYESLAHQQ